MNLLILILNRTYFFLYKVKNQSPFYGSIILVSLLIIVSIGNVQLLYYSFKSEYIITNMITGIIFLIITFTILYLYANKKRKEITNNQLRSTKIKNQIVLSIYLFTIITSIILSNINRKKIFEKKEINSTIQKKESLESKLKKYFN